MPLITARPMAKAQNFESADIPSGQNHDRIKADLQASPNAGGNTKRGDASTDVSAVQKMASATLGSLITSLLVTPLDVVRVRLQSQEHVTPRSLAQAAGTGHIRSLPTFANLPSNLGVTACCREVFWVNNNAQYCMASPSISIINNPTAGMTAAECAANEAQRKAFTSTFDGIRKIAQNEGLSTLWRGLTPTLVMAIPANVIYFAGYDWLRYNQASPIRRLNTKETYIPLIAGSAARVLAAVAVGPIEMFRTRMQATSSSSGSGHIRETFNSMRSLVDVQGYSALWRGLALTLWRDVPFSALYWWGYEYGRDRLMDIRENGRTRLDQLPTTSRSHLRGAQSHRETLIDSFIAGSGSGAVAALVTTPFDVGKTKQQVFQHATDAANTTLSDYKATPEGQSMPRFLWHIFKEQGMSGLFRGWAARCLKVAPACAIMISSYEIGKKWAGGINERRDAIREELASMTD